MRKKFALLHFVETLDQLPVKLSIFKKAPDLLRDWYIDKFNPYLMENIEIMGEEGYEVYLSLRQADALADTERAQRLIRRTLQDLKEYNVDILLPPKDCPFDFPKDLLIADGQRLFPYFIMDAIEKVLKSLSRHLKNTEIVILADDQVLTQNLLYNIYPHVNFLTVMVNRGEEEDYSPWVDFIFSDTGLNLGVSEKSKTLLGEADIVINTVDAAPGFDYSYKKGAVYFDLGTDRRAILNLAGIRDDLLIIDGLRLCFGDAGLPLPQAEAAFFVKSRAYRSLLHRGFSPELAEGTTRELKKLAPRLSHVCFRDQPLNNLYFAKLLALR